MSPNSVIPPDTQRAPVIAVSLFTCRPKSGEIEAVADPEVIKEVSTPIMPSNTVKLPLITVSVFTWNELVLLPSILIEAVPLPEDIVARFKPTIADAEISYKSAPLPENVPFTAWIDPVTIVSVFI